MTSNKAMTEESKIKEKLGDFFLDIAKLAFAGVILSTVLDISENKTMVLVFGISATTLFSAIGFVIYNLRKRR